MSVDSTSIELSFDLERISISVKSPMRSRSRFGEVVTGITDVVSCARFIRLSNEGLVGLPVGELGKSALEAEKG